MKNKFSTVFCVFWPFFGVDLGTLFFTLWHGRRVKKELMILKDLDLYNRRRVYSIDAMSDLRLGQCTLASRFHQSKRYVASNEMCSAGPVHTNPDHDFGHNAVSVDGIFQMKQKCRTSDDSDSWFSISDKRADEAFHSYTCVLKNSYPHRRALSV